MRPYRLPQLSRRHLRIIVFSLVGISIVYGVSVSDSQDTRDQTQSILEQRRAMMRGDALGRERVAPQRSTPAQIAKGEITFDDLQFDIEKDAAFEPEKLTDVVRSLNDRKVTLRGYILPTTLFRETDIDRFVLVRDNLECCFGPGAALFDCVMVEMIPGKTTNYVPRSVTVEGKFSIDTKSYRYPDGVGPRGATHMAVFKIEGVQVR
ncbi:MAG: DUF3299 domain-containing protein [Planctomycetota bacterium]